ncbi:MAG TPA: M28 family peptidase [Gemmatimonadales bacterium]|nr:M28 family peptidase [Gemmatimonadales bacterium]
MDLQLAFGPRPPASPAHAAMAQWLDSIVRAKADTVIVDSWTAVDLLFVDGEDYGDFTDSTETLLGSRRFARTVRGEYRPRLAIVWDMVADADQQFLQEGYSVTGVPTEVEAVWKCAARLGYAAQFVDRVSQGVIDDHLPLQRAGLDAIDVIDLQYGPDNTWHHTTEDTRDKISGASLARVTHVATALLRGCG